MSTTRRTSANIIAVEEVPMERTSAYGVVGVGKTNGNTFRITGMVEKPAKDDAPSNLIITGRYILQPEIFDLLGKQAGGAGGEIQITDSMVTLAESQPFYGVKFAGKSFDCGSKIGFLSANVAYAMERPDLAPALRDEIEKALRPLPPSTPAMVSPASSWTQRSRMQRITAV